MDSDVDADIPVRIKPTKKSQINEIKSPLFLPFSSGNVRSQNTVSPSSNYSLKSSKEKIDITEIRRILMKLKSEIEHEKKQNHELIEQNMKELNHQKHSLEMKHNKTIAQLNLSWKTKFDDLMKINNNHILEISKLKQKITDLSRSSSKHDLEISNMDDVVAKINEFCNLESNNFSNTEELVKIINDLNHLVKGRMPNQPIDQDSNEMKITKLQNQKTELTNIVKILDRKLKTSQNELINLKKKPEEKQISLMNELVTERHDESKYDFETMLKRANSERLLLEKQLTWLQNRDEENPATREKVETLTILVKSFHKNQKLLEDQLSVLRDKSNKTDNYINEISVLKIENEKLGKKLLDNSAIQKNYEKLKIEIESNQIRDQENLIKIKSLEILKEEYKTKLLAMDRLLKRETNTSNRDDHSEDSTEALKAELRELEKRCTQQALNYEEALLELEALKKTNQRSTFDFNRNGSKDDLAWLLQLMSNYSKEKSINNSGNSSVTDEFNGFNRDEFSKLNDPYGLKNILQNKTDDKIDIKRETAIFGRSDTVSSTNENDNKVLPSQQMSNSANNKEYSETPNNELVFNIDLESQRKHIPAPTQIKIENHPNQKGTRVVRWKVPQIDLNVDKCNITAFHIYVDGHFYKAVSINETLAAVLPNLDLKRLHRIVVRSVCSQGQSKDAQCTIEIGSFSLAPSHLKANKITGNSAQISWIPSNSNWRHTVWVNGSKYCDCIPGIYKIVMQGLQPDSLQKVQVHPVIEKFVDNSPNSNNCAFLDFQTLPIYNSNLDGIQKPTDEIDYPTDVKLKLGSRPGRFVVKWVCPQLVTSPNIKIVGYSILINNQCIALVNGAKNDRFSISLLDLRSINPPVSQNLLGQQDQSYLPLTVRTMATVTQPNFDTAVTECTIYSKDSQPILRFSGHVAARIAGTAAEAAIMLGDQLASFLNLQTQSPKNSKEYPQAKISVPKIQITKDSSFSEDDDNPSIMSYRSKGRSMGEQYGKISQQQKPVSRDQGEHKTRSNSTVDESVGMKIKNYPISQNDRIINQNQWNQNYNQDRINNINNERYNNYSHQKTSENIRYFVALFDYDPATMSPNSGAIHEELPFKAGQSIKVFGQVDEDGFYTGETNGRRGLVPSNMVNEIEIKNKFKPVDNSEIPFQERVIDRNKESSISRSLQGKLNIDQYPIESQNDYPNNQNQYSYNDYPMIHRKSTDSAVSYAASDPNSYQRSQVDTYMPRQPSMGNSRNPTEYRKMLALYDYDPQTLSPNVDSDAELAFKCNDIIEIIGEIDEDGFYMGRKNGQRGLVPSNFLTDLPPPLENRVRTQPNYQGSFDNMHNPNQYKERNFQPVTNFPEPQPNRDNRVRTKPFETERSLIRNTSANNDEYLSERVPLPDAQKNNPSFEESFDSGPSVSRTYMVKSEPKPNPYHNPAPRMSIHEQNIDNKGMMYSNSGSPSSKMPNRSNKPITDRRSSHDKPIHRNQQPINVPVRDLSPPPPLEADDMPIVMDLAPSKETQKKKKVSSNSENYRSNAFENQENYGNNESLYVNTNSVMSDNLERKRSVFKNPFKKKKS